MRRGGGGKSEYFSFEKFVFDDDGQLFLLSFSFPPSSPLLFSAIFCYRFYMGALLFFFSLVALSLLPSGRGSVLLQFFFTLRLLPPPRCSRTARRRRQRRRRRSPRAPPLLLPPPPLRCSRGLPASPSEGRRRDAPLGRGRGRAARGRRPEREEKKRRKERRRARGQTRRRRGRPPRQRRQRRKGRRTSEQGRNGEQEQGTRRR